MLAKTGRVYWITGLKSSGKTTIGTALYYALRKKMDNVLILDGDILRQFVGDMFGYSEDERAARGRRYSLLCKLLAEQGMVVVICTIAMSHEIRAWNREHIKGYIEVFVNTPIDIIRVRDKSGMYARNEVEINPAKIQFPLSPDIVVTNDGKETMERMVRDIMAVVPQSEDDFARDRLYWNRYYSGNQEIASKPSDFAKAAVKNMLPDKHLLELGCGNGRDSLFFLGKGLYVTGVDVSDEAINRLQSITGNSRRAMFVCDDFVKCRAVFQRQYDYVYSRFTLHSITDDQEDALLENIKEALMPGSRLFIEARTVHDDIFGKGEKVAPNAYIYEGHFRRFIDSSILKAKMEKAGYKIMELQEGKGFSTTKTSDPVLLRLIAEKRLDTKGGQNGHEHRGD